MTFKTRKSPGPESVMAAEPYSGSSEWTALVGSSSKSFTEHSPSTGTRFLETYAVMFKRCSSAARKRLFKS